MALRLFSIILMQLNCPFIIPKRALSSPRSVLFPAAWYLFDFPGRNPIADNNRPTAAAVFIVRFGCRLYKHTTYFLLDLIPEDLDIPPEGRGLFGMFRQSPNMQQQMRLILKFRNWGWCRRSDVH